MIKRKFGVGVFILVCVVMLNPFSGISQSVVESGENGSLERQKTLYERLGGYDAISAVVDEFLQRVWDDKTVGRFFVGMGTDTRNQLRQKNKNLLCANAGGPCKKINRPLQLAHEGLGITNHEFEIVINHLDQTLKDFKVPQREREEVMTKVGGLRSYIVEQ